jgi:formylglycine-generating enzyme required for sulfatase activity
LLAPGLTLRLVKIPASDDERVKPFYLAATELTEAQWAAAVTGIATSRNLPKVKVSFNECRLLCEKLNLLPIGRRFHFRLPTRAEFAHACGKPASYPGDLEDYAWCRENSPEQLQPVGQKKPNPLGLFDLVGNAWEWADDGRFYGMSSWDSIHDLNPILMSHDLPQNYQGTRADYSGDNLGLRVAADLR